MRGRARLLSMILLLVVAGCPYGTAVKRGDQYRQRGMWREAVAAYQEAIAIDPAEAEARLRLRETEQAWARELCVQGQAQARAGDLDGALERFGQAVRVDPESTAARQALARTLDERVAQGRAALAARQPARARDAFAAVLRHAPHHAQARQGLAAAQTVLAQRSASRGRGYEDRGRSGNALCAYARALELWRSAGAVAPAPGGAEAAVPSGAVGAASATAPGSAGGAATPTAVAPRAHALLQRLRRAVTFHIATGPFANRTPVRDLARVVGPDSLARTLDHQLPLRVVPSAPAGARGVRLEATLESYRHDVQRRVRRASVRYQSGTRRVPNPERERLERRVADQERDVARLEQEEGRHANRVDRARGQADRRQAGLERCREREQQRTNPCSSERSSLDSARRDVERERDRHRSVRRRLLDERRRLADLKQDYYRTPATVEEPVYADFFYDVQVYRAVARVGLRYRLTDLFDRRVVDERPVTVEAVATDEVHDAYPRFRIRRDRLELPRETVLRSRVAAAAVQRLRRRLLVAFDAYRATFRDDAARMAHAGQDESAVEFYVRALLVSPGEQVPGAAEHLRRHCGLQRLEWPTQPVAAGEAGAAP